MLLAIPLLIATSFILSFFLTLAMKHFAPRIGFVDKPGNRKIHSHPRPLGGGVAIFWAIVLPLVAILIFAWFEPISLRPDFQPLIGGVRLQTPLAGAILIALFLIHLIGLWDDKKALGPFVKLIAQALVTGGLVVLFDVRILTALGSVISIIITVLWITAVTNAFNFLDNMDGLSAGIAAICALAFLITTISIHQWFIAAGLALLIGALLGFLCFNFSPASIFMGDSGSLVIGFLLGVLTARTTFLPRGMDIAAGWYSLLAPLIVLALPLYDLFIVVIIRASLGKSPFVGDTNHFSHRLVARGMSRRTAVLCLYLVTAATSIAAILLPRVQSTFGAVLILAQTLLILGVVALLERHPMPAPVP